MPSGIEHFTLRKRRKKIRKKQTKRKLPGVFVNDTI
jgi:hypothetical protein